MSSPAIPQRSRRVTLASRPVGEPTAANVSGEEVAVPSPGPGEALVRTVYLSLDPYMRGRMSDAKSYAKPVGIGEVMVGGAVGQIAASNAPELPVGAYVVGQWGWQE